MLNCMIKDTVFRYTIGEIMRYKAKATEIEAELVTADNREELANWCGGRVGWVETIFNIGVFVQTNNGETFAPLGHYIVKGVSDFYPCDPITFVSRWEPIDAR